MQPKIIKSKNNGCGTAPGNLVSKQYLKVFSEQDIGFLTTVMIAMVFILDNYKVFKRKLFKK